MFAGQSPSLVPQPREVETTGSIFRIVAVTRIVMVDNSAQDRFAATVLQDELRLATGRSLPIVTALQEASGAIVLGRTNGPALRRLLLQDKLDVSGLAKRATC
jgi:Glycosyl hydrolase family 20, domain 2